MQWINVSNQLPPPEEVDTWRSIDVLISIEFPERGYYSFADGSWYMYRHAYPVFPKHWHLLPAPPTKD